jgi:hypothetical protein
MASCSGARTSVMNLIPIRISALADHSKADELQRFTEGRNAISRGRKESFCVAGSGRSDAQPLLELRFDFASRQRCASAFGMHFDR